MPRQTLDRELLEAAIVGLEQRRNELASKIADLRSRLGRKRPGGSPGAAPARKKRVLSAAARKRIAEAQKRRWAAFKKAKAKAS